MANKHELISKLLAVFASWEEFLAGVNEDEMTIQPQTGQWSISEVITHLHAWQQVSIAHLEAAAFNKDPSFPEWLDGADPSYAEDHVDEFNARIQEVNRAESWSTRHSEWSEGSLRFIKLAETIPDSIMFDSERYIWLGGNALGFATSG